MFKHVLWDMGGTLLDTYADVDACLFDHVRRYGRIAQLVEVSRLTRVSIAHAVDVLSERYGIPAADLQEGVDRLKHRWERHPPKVADGAQEVMAAVRRAGGFNLVVTHRDRASAELLLRKRHLDLIDDMICAPDGYARKPDPQMYHLMVERHGLEEADCLGVGDRQLDCDAARAAGISAALLVPEIPARGVKEGKAVGNTSRRSPYLAEPTTLFITGLRQLLPFVEAKGEPDGSQPPR